MNLFRKPKLNQRGDTIIEVMIVLAILGLAFAIASTTATKGLNQSRNAQEHSRALGIVNSQIEMVRVAVAKNVQLPSSGQFCMKQTATGPDKTTNLSECIDNSDPNSTDNIYNPVITASANGNYTFEVKWSGTSDLGDQRELMHYRINELLNSTVAEISKTTEYSVNVYSKYIPPAGTGTDPDCTNTTNSKPFPSANVKLVGPGGFLSPSQTDSNGDKPFTTGLGDGNYPASIDGSAPTGFEVCSPAGQAVTLSDANSNAVANLYLKPITKRWTGLQRSGCVPLSSVGDGKDGCQPYYYDGVYMYRNGGPEFTIPSGFPIGKTCLRLAYSQRDYNGATVPPPPYQYKFSVNIGANTTNIDLPIGGSSGDNVDEANCHEVQIPSGATKMQLLFTNDTSSPGHDSNPVIYRVQIYHMP